MRRSKRLKQRQSTQQRRCVGRKHRDLSRFGSSLPSNGWHSLNIAMARRPACQLDKKYFSTHCGLGSSKFNDDVVHSHRNTMPRRSPASLIDNPATPSRRAGSRTTLPVPAAAGLWEERPLPAHATPNRPPLPEPAGNRESPGRYLRPDGTLAPPEQHELPANDARSARDFEDRPTTARS